MKKVLNIYKRICGKQFPRPLLAELSLESLVPLDKKPLDKALLIGSLKASKNPLLVQADISEFIKSGPKGYFLMGFWGHGVNSYAFYYSRVDSWSRVFFRLPYGGAYGDSEREGLLVGQFMETFAFYEKRLKESCKSIIAVDSMGDGYYKIVGKNRKSMELKESLYGRMDIGRYLFCQVSD
ncbi:MAG: hypothetical protein QHH14_14615 [Clostridiales bacterium]|nr:hypothetical protein [Clostridiales bacterium]